ncbi:MAG: lactate racemase domain-containing protein [Chitinispirillaceae bacterium]|jgi:nickel-dependent lactate racemase|nr:lactate racemase domain-containing protein [Chitinispirillaceae bacterium]
MMLHNFSSRDRFLSDAEVKQAVLSALDKMGVRKKTLIVPPDITRMHSGAGKITQYVYEKNPSAVSAILPALGTHVPMPDDELEHMFGDIPKSLFHPHDWRNGCVTLGEIPASFVRNVSEGSVDYSIPVSVDKLLVEGGFDCILSIGQIVPHEVAGFAGHNKNLFVGLGGAENIHKSHFLGAAYGMEKIMGHADTPVRAVFDYAIETFLGKLPISHIITVMDRDDKGGIRPRGLFIGSGKECFNHAAACSLENNITLLDNPLKTVVTWLDAMEYKSTWLGNKSIYRTRMAIADGGNLIVLAPGISKFGEDGAIDKLIREFGYKGTPAITAAMKQSETLRNNLSAAAHLIHGSSEGRFAITYCTEALSRAEIEGVGFKYAPLSEMMKKYDPAKLKEGVNTLSGGEEIFYISNPATGLWAWKKKFV